MTLADFIFINWLICFLAFDFWCFCVAAKPPKNSFWLFIPGGGIVALLIFGRAR